MSSRHFSKITRSRALGRILLAGVCFSGVLLSNQRPTLAQAPISQVIAFGDSLTDNGNLYAASGQTVPRDPYYQGRLSNGPVWVERFAQGLGAGLTDFAVAGAFTNTDNVSNTIPNVPPGTFPGIETQVNLYLGLTNGNADANALYVLWGGANDYLNGQGNPVFPVNNIAARLTSLVNAGARRFLVPNLPDLGRLPGTAGGPFATALSTLTSLHNAGLVSMASNLRATFPAIQLTLLDVNTLFNNTMTNPAAFGFDNVTDKYVDSHGPIPGLTPESIGTGDPNRYLFWDEVHPTAAGHQLVANLAGQTVSPEPGTIGLLSLGGLSFLPMVRRWRCRHRLK